MLSRDQVDVGESPRQQEAKEERAASVVRGHPRGAAPRAHDALLRPR